MAKGKLINIQPFIINGVHQTYQGQKGLFYKFIIGFNNGDVGDTLSTFQQPKWELNAEYTYNIKEREYQGKKQYSFSNLNKVVNNNQQQSTSTYQAKTKEEWYSHSMQIAIEVTSSLYKYNTTMNLDYNLKNQVIEYFHNWIIGIVKDNDKMYWNAFNALRSAINFAVAPKTDIIKTSQIVLLANSLFAMCEIEAPKDVPQQPKPEIPKEPIVTPHESQFPQMNNQEFPEDCDELPF